jgi:nucleotide-binding universal stress UspA family protein
MTTATVSSTITRTNTSNRITIKNILFPTDFSPQSQVAAGYCKMLAEHYGATIHAVHVFSPELYGALPAESMAIAAIRLRTDLRERMEATHERFRGVKHDTQIAEGPLWVELEKIIRQEKIDFIVMGSSGRRGLERVALGSTAEEVVRRAACPVMTIGPNCVEANDESFRQILFTTDFNGPAGEGIRYALSLAQEYAAKLTLAHILEQDGVAGDRHRTIEYFAERLRKLVPRGAELWCEPEIALHHGHAAEWILTMAIERRASLVVLGARNVEHPVAVAHFRDSTAAKVIRGAPCPVLTVRNG